MSERSPSKKEIELKDEIESYEKNLDQYRFALNKESVWLFVATLGCWSVNTNRLMQILAFVVTLIFFYSLVNSHLSDKKSFDSFEKRIEELIAGEFIDGSKKDGYSERLKQIKSKRESNLKPLSDAPMFFVSVVFFCFSVFDQVFGGF